MFGKACTCTVDKLVLIVWDVTMAGIDEFDFEV